MDERGVDAAKFLVSDSKLLHFAWDEIVDSWPSKLEEEKCEDFNKDRTYSTSASLTSRNKISRPSSFLKFKVMERLLRLTPQK